MGRRTFGYEHQWWLRVFRQRPGHVECPNVRGRPRNNLHWPITQVVEQGRYCVAVLADNRICALSCDKLAGLACEISESKSTVVNISLARRQKWQRDPIGRCIPDQERCLHDEACLEHYRKGQPPPGSSLYEHCSRENCRRNCPGCCPVGVGSGEQRDKRDGDQRRQCHNPTTGP